MTSALWLGTLLLPLPVGARQVGQVGGRGAPAGELQALRLDDREADALRLDGLLDEAFWQRASVIDDFRQREPEVGEPATEETRVRVVISDGALLVGVEALDSEPDRIVGRILQRDRIMSVGMFPGLNWAGDDGIAILLDPFHDHRNAVVLATNPNGAEFDALVTDEGREINVSWRGVWRVAAARTPRGWSAEFEVPLRSIRYPDDAGGEPWGFNVFRVIRRKNEEVLWRSWSRQNEGFHRVSRAGHLTGVTDLPRPGLNLEVKPYLLAGTEQVRAPDGDIPVERDLEVGLDLKSELRPGLVLDLTANTDFAQVEVDDEQVNLTRFDLFFPEKRDFFLENAGIFELGLPGFGGPPPMLMFFSRRVGIGPQGEEVPLLGGARLTGRVGGQTVGLLTVATDEAGAIPRESFSVARVKRDLGERDYVGFMVTDRRRLGGLPHAALDEAGPGEDPDLLHPANTVVGVDGSYWLTERLQFQGFAVASRTEGPGGEDAAWRAALDFTADRYGFFLQHLTIQPGLTTRSGFTLRTDVRQHQAFFRFSPRPQRWGLRRVDLRASGMHQTRTDGAFQDWSGGLDVSPLWNSGDNVTVGFSAGRTQVDEAFPLAGRAPVPAGRYRTDAVRWSASTS
ncbi:MAG: DUF5916 domain-containing protein, partial [Gemmatimonadota bacterium]